MTEETLWEEYLPSLYTCRRCRWCMTSGAEYKPVCPMKERYGFVSYSAAGLIMLARSLQDGTLHWEPEIADIVYTCTMCKACSAQCGNIYYLSNEYFNVPMLVEKLREELIIRGKIPPLVRDYLKSIDLYGNPYKEPESNRSKWADGLGIPEYSGQEFLFYVGDEGSFDERGMKIARAVGTFLLKNGFSVGILGSEEISDGNEVKALGESGLFELLATKNIATFNRLGVKKIITLSPHGYNAIKNEYPKLGGEFEVLHYTQVLNDLIGQGRIKLPGLDAKVTYHDPCYLGRHNNEYEAPRNILRSVPGAELVEMSQVREEALCCGGGGGNFYTDMLGSGANSPSRIRVRQACEAGADILAVACPACAKMLDDAVKDEGLAGKLEVRDIAEIVNGTVE